MPRIPDKRSRRPADETRREILQVAEAAFATAGFEATRLEDIAGRIGIQRAALFYHFRDKHDLYENVLRQLWVDLGDVVSRSLKNQVGLEQQIAAGLVAVADFLVARPAFPYLILRLGSEPGRGADSATATLTTPLMQLLEQFLHDGETQGLFKPVTRDPALFAATLAGATVFYAAAMPGYSANARPLPAKTYREELVKILRGLLGMRA